MKQTILLMTAIALAILIRPHTPSLYVSGVLSHKIASDIPHIALSPTPTPRPSEVIYEVARAFEPFGTDVVAQSILVAKDESGWRHNAQGWNCMYDGVSKPCKKEDRPNAWSVDCGLMQINVKGTVCPVELFDIKTNISKAVAMYEHRKWSPWVTAKKLGYVN